MGVGDGRLAHVVLDRVPPFLVGPDQLDFHPGPVRGLPVDDPVGDDLGRVLTGVDLDLVVVGGLSRAGAGGDDDGLPGGEQPVHPGRRNPDPLLPARLLEDVKLRSVQELAEDLRDLRLDDPGPVVLHRHAKALILHMPDGDPDRGEESRLLAGVERVVHGLLDGGQQRLLRVVESQQVPVLAEKFRYRNFPLAPGHAFRGLALAGPRGGGLSLGHGNSPVWKGKS